MNARALSDHLSALLRTEQHAMAEFLLALADFDRQRAWAELGHATLFSYLRRELHLSAGAAQYRKTAAELVQRFPSVERALRDGKLCLSSVIELAKVLTAENETVVLPRFFGLSRREAAAVAVSIVPVENAPVREVITAVRSAPAHVTEPVRTSEVRPAEMDQPGCLALGIAAAPEQPPRPLPPAPSSPEPLSAELARLHVNVSKAFLEKLDAARDALSHVNPDATMADILEAGLDLILAARDQRRGTGRKPATTKRPAHPDTITADVRRTVWTRDDGRCQWRLETGEICGSTFQCELDHVTAKARGGEPTVDGLRVLCRAHNLQAARDLFGDTFIDRKIAARRAGRAAPHPRSVSTTPSSTRAPPATNGTVSCSP